MYVKTISMQELCWFVECNSYAWEQWNWHHHSPFAEWNQPSWKEQVSPGARAQGKKQTEGTSQRLNYITKNNIEEGSLLMYHKLWLPAFIEDKGLKVITMSICQCSPPPLFFLLAEINKWIKVTRQIILDCSLSLWDAVTSLSIFCPPS